MLRSINIICRNDNTNLHEVLFHVSASHTPHDKHLPHICHKSIPHLHGVSDHSYNMYSLGYFDLINLIKDLRLLKNHQMNLPNPISVQ